MVTIIILLVFVPVIIGLVAWLPNGRNDNESRSSAYAVIVSAAVLNAIVMIAVYIMSVGVPKTVSLAGEEFTPHAFVVTSEEILIYNNDGKVYVLDDRIKFDDGLTPETLDVGTNVSYVVYERGPELLFGRLSQP